MLYVEPTSISGRSSFSCIQTTLSSLRGSAFAAAAALSSLSSGFSTRYLVIFFSILIMVTPARFGRLRGERRPADGDEQERSSHRLSVELFHQYLVISSSANAAFSALSAVR